MSSWDYGQSTRRRPLLVLASVLSLVVTAILIGLVASGELLGNEDVSALTSVRDEQQFDLPYNTLNELEPYPTTGYVATSSGTRIGFGSAYPSPLPALPGTTVQTRASESTHPVAESPAGEPGFQASGRAQASVKQPHRGESLKIASPNDEVQLCSAFTVEGSASGLLSGQLAMILLQSTEGGKIYPQGPLLPNENGDWRINIVGLPLGKRFSLTPILPHGESLTRLNEYLKEGRSTGVWAGMDDIGADANTFADVSILIAPIPCPGVEHYSPGDDTEYNGYKVIGS